VANNEIEDNKKQRQIAGNFIGHADTAVQSVAHHPTRSHQMLLSGKCPRRIAPAATKVMDIGCKHKNTNKTQLLASSKTRINFGPQNKPSTHIIYATSCVKL
jgi:hypothetical protein